MLIGIEVCTTRLLGFPMTTYEGWMGGVPNLLFNKIIAVNSEKKVYSIKLHLWTDTIYDSNPGAVDQIKFDENYGSCASAKQMRAQ
jgi:hypothetical protein